MINENLVILNRQFLILIGLGGGGGVRPSLISVGHDMIRRLNLSGVTMRITPGPGLLVLVLPSTRATWSCSSVRIWLLYQPRGHVVFLHQTDIHVRCCQLPQLLTHTLQNVIRVLGEL